ncbi:hypothetical protein NPIL_594901, partial [Nephila pilipes]
YCDFEQDMCKWENGEMQYLWKRMNGLLISGENIGPTVDQTTSTINDYYTFAVLNVILRFSGSLLRFG